MDVDAWNSKDFVLHGKRASKLYFLMIHEHTSYPSHQGQRGELFLLFGTEPPLRAISWHVKTKKGHWEYGILLGNETHLKDESHRGLHTSESSLDMELTECG